MHLYISEHGAIPFELMLILSDKSISWMLFDMTETSHMNGHVTISCTYCIALEHNLQTSFALHVFSRNPHCVHTKCSLYVFSFVLSIIEPRRLVPNCTILVVLLVVIYFLDVYLFLSFLYMYLLYLYILRSSVTLP